MLVSGGVVSAGLFAVGIWSLLDAQADRDEAAELRAGLPSQDSLSGGSQVCDVAGADCIGIDQKLALADGSSDTALWMFVLGGAMLAGTVTFAIVGASSGDADDGDSADQATVSIVPVTSPQAGGVLVQGRF